MKYLPSSLKNSNVADCLLQKIYLRPTRIVWHNDKATGCENIIINEDHQMMAGESKHVRNHAWIAPGGAVLIQASPVLTTLVCMAKGILAGV